MLDVFKFTFIQQLKTRSYRTATAAVALVLLIASAGVILLVDKLDSDNKVSDISKVYVYDNGIYSDSSSEISVYNSLHMSENENFKDVVFVDSDEADEEKAAKIASDDSDHSVAMEVSGDVRKGIKIKVIIPAGFNGDRKSPDRLAGFVKTNLGYVISVSEGLSDKTIREIAADTSTSVVTAGEDASKEKQIARMVAPLAAGFALYIMLAVYGQNVARGVVLEKDSKIIESLLVIVKPNDIVFGKLLGICSFALFQVTVWLISLVAGFGLGYAFTGGKSGSGSDAVKKIFEAAGDFADSGVLSAGNCILSFVIFITGFVLFCAIAAFFGSFAGKSEEVPTYFSIYTMIMVVSWIFPYMNGLNGNDHMMNILRYIPLTAPFTVPADILVGNMTAGQAAVSMAVMVVTAVILTAAAGKVYNALILYNGTPIKPKDIITILKGNANK